MATIKDQAINFSSRSTKNICELDKVSVDLEIIEKMSTDSEGKEFHLNCITVNGNEYRIPDIVLKYLKAILIENPNLKFFKVKRHGTGMATNYTVIPLS